MKKVWVKVQVELNENVALKLSNLNRKMKIDFLIAK